MYEETHDPRIELAYMTRPEAEAALRRRRRAILPVGATEQHGSHLPMGTDTFLAHELSMRLADRLGAVVLPTLPVSYSWVWRDIPGSLFIDQGIVREVIKGIARSLEPTFVEQLIIVNGHGANQSALKYAARELTDEIGLRVFYFTYPGFDKVSELAESPQWHGMVHACELETSWVLAVRPELCRMEAAVREYPEDRSAFAYHYSTLPMGALSKSGVFGDATLATPEKGSSMVEVMVSMMEEIVRASGSLKEESV